MGEKGVHLFQKCNIKVVGEAMYVAFASSATKMLVVFNLTSGPKGCERVNGSHVFRGEKFKQRGAFGWPNFHEQASIDLENSL